MIVIMFVCPVVWKLRFAGKSQSCAALYQASCPNLIAPKQVVLMRWIATKLLTEAMFVYSHHVSHIMSVYISI